MIPLHSAKIVAEWWRRLVRCLRAAGRGDIEMARSLRPGDVWLEHAQNSVPATAPWDWDLRPLDVGKPAHPLLTSGREGVKRATGVDLVLLEKVVEEGLRELGFVDEAIVAELLCGVSDDSKCRRGTLLCAPHVGVLRSYAEMVKKTKASVAAGWATVGRRGDMWSCRAGRCVRAQCRWSTSR